MLIILPSISEEAGRLLSHLAALPLQSNCAWASSVSRPINSSCSWKQQAALSWTTLQLRPPDLLTREQGSISLPWLKTCVPSFFFFFSVFLWYLIWQVETFRVALKIKMWWEHDEALEEMGELLNRCAGMVEVAQTALSGLLPRSCH